MTETDIVNHGQLFLNDHHQMPSVIPAGISYRLSGFWYGTFTFIPKRPEISIGARKVIPTIVINFLDLFSICKSIKAYPIRYIAYSIS